MTNKLLSDLEQLRNWCLLTSFTLYLILLECHRANSCFEQKLLFKFTYLGNKSEKPYKNMYKICLLHYPRRNNRKVFVIQSRFQSIKHIKDQVYNRIPSLEDWQLDIFYKGKTLFTCFVFKSDFSYSIQIDSDGDDVYIYNQDDFNTFYYQNIKKVFVMKGELKSETEGDDYGYGYNDYYDWYN